jgi:hypothetical protein
LEQEIHDIRSDMSEIKELLLKVVNKWQ